VSIAALVTGLLGLNVVAIVLGVLGLRRTKRNGTKGRGMAIAGIVLGGVGLIALIAVVAAIALGISTYDRHIDQLHDRCGDGDMVACDRLYSDAVRGSEEEEFGATCGGRTEGLTDCAGLDANGSAPSEEGDASDEADPFGEDPAAPSSDPSDLGTLFGDADSYGDDPRLDSLWDACEAGDGQACDDLYLESPFGSEYEEFGDTCGGRTAGGPRCSATIAG
jgi:hypothetical protein